MGMTAEQYWEGDASLPKYYRKADKIKTEKRNFDLWLQGRYFYDALCCASPLLQSFAKRGTQANPYTSKPYPLSADAKQRDEEAERREVFERGKRRMESFMVTHNMKFAAMQQANESG